LVDGEGLLATRRFRKSTQSPLNSAAGNRWLFYETPNTGADVHYRLYRCKCGRFIYKHWSGTQDTGGTWIDTDGTGALSGNTFDASAVSPERIHLRYHNW
jgi:hypothetical protein